VRRHEQLDLREARLSSAGVGRCGYLLGDGVGVQIIVPPQLLAVEANGEPIMGGSSARRALQQPPTSTGRPRILRVSRDLAADWGTALAAYP
jgi:hypothetical protein